MEVPSTPGYPDWCAACGWNLEPPPPLALRRGRFAQFADALGRRSGEALARDGKAPRRGWSAARVLSCAIAVGVLALDAALVLGGVAAIVAEFPNLVTSLIGATMISVGIVLRPRVPRLPGDGGVVLDRERAPTLHALVDEIAAAAGVAAPHGIVVNADWNASWAIVGLRRRRWLTLGLPLWASLEPQQRVALIAHEAGHERAGGQARSLVVWTAVNALDHLSAVLRPPDAGETAVGGLGVDALARSVAAVVALPVDGVLWLQARLLLRELQRDEYLADGHAAAVAGSPAVIALHERSLLSFTFGHAVQRAALADEDVFALLREALAAVPDRERERRRRLARLEQTRLTDTHPPMAMRIALLEERAPDAATVTLGAWTSQRIDAELEPLHARLARELLDSYRGSLYSG